MYNNRFLDFEDIATLCASLSSGFHLPDSLSG